MSKDKEGKSCRKRSENQEPRGEKTPSLSLTASLTNTSLVCPFHFGSLSGNSCPMSGLPSAPRIASVTVCSSASPSECATQPRSCGILMPPRMSS